MTTTDRSEENVEVEELKKGEEEEEEEEEDPDEEMNDVEEKEEEKDDRGEKNVKVKVEVIPFTMSRLEKRRIESYETYKLKKEKMNKKIQIWNRSHLAEFEDPTRKEREKKMKEGRVVIKDAGSCEHEIKKSSSSSSSSRSSSSSSRKGKEKVNLEDSKQVFDPLFLVHDIILGFSCYIEIINEMASERPKSEKSWIDYFEIGIRLFEKLTATLRLMKYEMRRMKEEEDRREDYVKIHEFLSKLDDINQLFYTSPSCILTVTERDLTALELAMCELQFKRCRGELEELTRLVERLELVFDVQYGPRV